MNALNNFNSNPKKNPLEQLLRGEAVGKGFQDKVNENLNHAKKALENNSTFAVIFDSYKKDFQTCGVNGSCTKLCEKIAQNNQAILAKEVAWGDAADHAAYVMALALAKREGPWKEH